MDWIVRWSSSVSGEKEREGTPGVRGEGKNGMEYWGENDLLAILVLFPIFPILSFLLCLHPVPFLFRVFAGCSLLASGLGPLPPPIDVVTDLRFLLYGGFRGRLGEGPARPLLGLLARGAAALRPGGDRWSRGFSRNCHFPGVSGERDCLSSPACLSCLVGVGIKFLFLRVSCPRRLAHPTPPPILPGTRTKLSTTIGRESSIVFSRSAKRHNRNHE